MKRKILLSILLFATFCTTAYAAVNGTFKGNPIVRVFVNGSEIKPDVPGQVMGGSTMLPIRAVGEALGASVTWDKERFIANVTMPQEAVQSGLTLAELNKIGESVGMVTALDSNGRVMRYGSGFIINGLLVTNHHVVKDSASLKITFGTKETTVPSTYVFNNEVKDLAAVRFEGQSLKLNLTPTKKGDKVYTMGFPFEKFQISEGSILFYDLDGQIVHDAKTDHGSSGGVVVDADGKVIGITTGGMEGTIYNDATPTKHLQEELDKL